MDRIDEICNELNSLYLLKDDIFHQISKLNDERLEIYLKENKKFIGKIYKSKSLDCITFYKILDVDNANQFRMKTLVIKILNESLTNIDNEALVSIENYPWFCYNKSGEEVVPEINLLDVYEEITDKVQIDKLNNMFDNILFFSNIKIEDDSNE